MSIATMEAFRYIATSLKGCHGATTTAGGPPSIWTEPMFRSGLSRRSRFRSPLASRQSVSRRASRP